MSCLRTKGVFRSNFYLLSFIHKATSFDRNMLMEYPPLK